MEKFVKKTESSLLELHAARLIRHMGIVEQNRQMLQELSRNWDMLSLLSQLGDAGMNMGEIKENFTNLSKELIEHLSKEVVQKREREMHFRAQVAVDILTRNLFERTADVGFLAMDADVKAFLHKSPTKYNSVYKESSKRLRERFASYVANYSVYFDILLFNTHGDLLLSLDETLGGSKSNDPLLSQALHSQASYIESYKHHDFLPKNRKTLLYATAVHENCDPESDTLGVLSLCFKFQDEMRAIFENLLKGDTKEALLIVDAEGEVLATSDAFHIPLGAKVEIVLGSFAKIVTFGGREYLAKSSATSGYQGFFGLGWYGHSMVALEYAFDASGHEDMTMGEAMLLAILEHSERFSHALKSIPLRANSIQNNLHRSLWNGNIRQSDMGKNRAFSHALLDSIRKTGEDTKSIVGSSIASLTKTMVLGDTLLYADLIVEIMDRNLYERANDCRWWALTSDFREILAQPQKDAYNEELMSNILYQINALYTVYANLIIFDASGCVRAVSNQKYGALVSKQLFEPWCASTLALEDATQYHVSEFAPTPLYDGLHTYIFSAAIHAPAETRVVGGIGIVFDAAVQFEAMILDSLPKSASQMDLRESFGVIIDANMRIIASSTQTLCVGGYLEIAERFVASYQEDGVSEIIVFRGNYYALGVVPSHGYREYKRDRNMLQNTIFGCYFSYISSADITVQKDVRSFATKERFVARTQDAAIDIASFMIGNQWFGINAASVVEAVSAQSYEETLNIDHNHYFKGTLFYRDTAVMVVDLQGFLHDVLDAPYSEIVIITYGNGANYLGILVHSLEEIAEICVGDLKELQAQIIGEKTMVEYVAFVGGAQNATQVLSILSVEKIVAELIRPQQAKSLPPRLRG